MATSRYMCSFGSWGLVVGAHMMALLLSARATEYELQGNIQQTIFQRNGKRLQYTNEFAIYVRDSAWLIATIEHGDRGEVWRREIGSTNGSEICELILPLDSTDGPAGAKRSLPFRQGFISRSTVPVDRLDTGVIGHLWVMFASRDYWPLGNAGMLTPPYDWHATVGANPGIKVAAEWELIDGPGSLPREVRYLGHWEETNGLYRMTGVTNVGKVPVPRGFIFEEKHVGAQLENSLLYGMALRKRVEAKVTSASSMCSRENLLPARGYGRTVIIDWRLEIPNAENSIPTYSLPDLAWWPTVEEAKKLLPKHEVQNDSTLMQIPPSRRIFVLISVVCLFLFTPAAISLLHKRSRKHAPRRRMQ
jgi:hypothetical protein